MVGYKTFIRMAFQDADMEDVSSLLAGADLDAYQRLVCWVAQQLEKKGENFTSVLSGMRSAVQQVDSSVATERLLECLLWCAQQGDNTAAPVVQHILVEAIPAQAAATSPEHVKQLAVRLLLTYCSSANGKLASKVATVFDLKRGDLDAAGWQQLTAAVPMMLQQPSTYKPAVFLMMQFEGLDEVVDRRELLEQLVADGQDSLAQHWATSLGRDYQVAFVEACIALDRLKPAARAVRQLGLASEFPDIESMYRQRSLGRLMGKRLWSVAQSYAGNDVALQTQLVRGMSDAGELVLAEEYRQQAGLPRTVLAPPDPAELAAQEAARREAYLQLALPADCVLWVDDAPGCVSASQLLSGSSVLGIDVEWKPSHVAGVTSPAAVLQVASRTAVVLFDLISLCQQNPAALESCLGPLLLNPGVIKLGFEVAGDVAKLAGSWPSVACFRTVVGVLDLLPLWVAYGLSVRHQGGSARVLSSVGLSTLCSTLLGKPLDKSQQMSDWSARPLTERQLQYAALDAFVLPQLYDVLRDRLDTTAAEALVAQHTKTLSRGKHLPSAASSDALQPNQQQARLATQQAAPGAAAAARPATSTSAPATAADGGGAGAGAGVGAGVGAAGTQACCSPTQAGEGAVLAALQQYGLQDRYRRLPSSTGTPHATAWDTAAALGVPTSSVAKTMTLLINQQPHLVVTRGDQRIDMHKLAALLGVKRRAIVIAPQDTVLRLTGFASGVPPMAHGDAVQVIFDRRLATPAVNTAAPAPASGADNVPDSSNAVDTSHSATDASRPHAVLAHAAPQPPQYNMSSGNSRGGLGVVAAMALQAQQPVPSMQQPAATSADAAAADEGGVRGSGAAGSSVGGSGQLLTVQCGPDAAVLLSFEELLLLSGAAVTADVADAPAEAAAVSTLTGAPAGTASQQQGPAPTATTKFLLDSMLGRLCRWLRALGIDAEFIEPVQQGQAQQQSALIQQIQEAALLQGRLFITRDQKLAMRRDVGGSVYLLNSNDAAEQLAELSHHFGIKLDESTLMSRCGACNAAAYTRISHEEAAAHVTDKLLELVDEFWQCGKCGKVVWMGPKSYAAINLLEGLFTDGKTRPTPLQSLKNPPPREAQSS